MITEEKVRQLWRARKYVRKFHPGLSLVEDRIEFSEDAPLVRLIYTRGGEYRLDCEGGEERALARLASVYCRPLSRERTLGALRRALLAWNGGEQALAYIHLAHAHLAKFDDPDLASYRLSLTDELLDEHAFSPRALLKALGLEAQDQIEKEFDPCQPRVCAGNGRQSGRWTKDGSVDFAWAAEAAPHGSDTKTIPQAKQPRKYHVVHETPLDAVSVKSPDGYIVPDPSSPTKTLLAPPKANYQTVYARGAEIGKLPLSEQLNIAIPAAVGQEGTFDWQRDKSTMSQYPAYVHASNYSAGVLMAGAGHSLPVTIIGAEYYALEHSSNYGSMDQIGWVIRGWLDAHAGHWKSP